MLRRAHRLRGSRSQDRGVRVPPSAPYCQSLLYQSFTRLAGGYVVPTLYLIVRKRDSVSSSFRSALGTVVTTAIETRNTQAFVLRTRQTMHRSDCCELTAARDAAGNGLMGRASRIVGSYLACVNSTITSVCARRSAALHSFPL